MDASWTKSPTGRRVLEHWADPRPAWLWSADGQALLWRNLAARLFPGKGGKRGSVPADAMPIRGQVARLIRLGSLNRSSLSRMQFVVDDRPVSATCACTPLTLADGQVGLLVVNVDPIGPEQLTTLSGRDTAQEALFPAGADYLLIDDDGQFGGGSPRALERYAPVLESEGLPPLNGADGGSIVVAGQRLDFTRFKASPQDASLLLFEPLPGAAGEIRPASAVAEPPVAEPLLPMGLPPAAPVADLPVADEHWPEPPHPATVGGLTSLFDRLLDHEPLYRPLEPENELAPHEPPTADEPVAAAAADANTAETSSEAGSEAMAVEAQAVADVPEAARRDEAVFPVTGEDGTPAAPPAPVAEVPVPPQEPAPEAPGARAVMYRIIGRGFTPLVDTAAAGIASDTSEEAPAVEGAAADYPAALALFDNGEAAAGNDGEAVEAAAPAAGEPSAGPDIELADELAPAAPPAEEAPAAGPDAESVERVSRYNFDELSRILNDRVGNGDNGGERGNGPFAAPRPSLPTVPSATPEGALVTLGGETLVLNRLPLGILVFRDQQVLFANRAITEMTGYDSVEKLRAAGLAAIFPAIESAPEAGPVNHLVQRDGALLPVTARLQSVSWQGRPALMLSASATEVRTGHEAAVRAFAEMLAATRADGFIEAARSGVLTHVSGEARLILKRDEAQLVGKPVSTIAAPAELPALREFLERPARFAETARPAITVKGIDRGVEILLFAQGQAGVITNYFGFVRRTGGTALAAPGSDADPALLARLSRGVRRPLNTVIGFSDLIGSAAFGPVDNERYVEYARDIKTAGLEIAALVDELDDFARLRDGRYTARPSDIDLAVLLGSSVARVRGQANAARVLVRSAISESLPRVRADRASLAQAILNLLASAIDQTPQDGSVVLSAQVDDAGGIAINVRDSAHSFADLGERFVVFRDGVGRDGEVQTPVRSSVGLALTRALLAVNQSTLSVDPAGAAGTLFSLTIPADNVVQAIERPADPRA